MVGKRARRLNLDLNLISDEGLEVLAKVMEREVNNTNVIKNKMALIFFKTELEFALRGR